MVLPRKYGVELPICRAVHNILYESADPSGGAAKPCCAAACVRNSRIDIAYE